MKPLIGITCNFIPKKLEHTLAQAYAHAIESAGGVPLLVPLLEEAGRQRILEVVHGLLLSGGGDIGSFFFGEEPLPGQGQVYPALDRHEIKLARQALKGKLPLLGICRGMQVINVAAGGTLYQDLYEQEAGCLQHFQNMPGKYPVHTVWISSNSRLFAVNRSARVQVNSFHHQAVRTPAPGSLVSGAALDGVVEALEMQEHPFALGVQWHPERMDNVASRELFREFVKAAAFYGRDM